MCVAALAGGVAGPLLWGAPAWVWIFCGFIILSRLGMWMFDMAHAQILQQNVPEKEMSTVGGDPLCAPTVSRDQLCMLSGVGGSAALVQVGGVELSFCSLAELVTLGIAALVADRSGGFTLLVLLSCAAVTCGATMFSSWVLSGDAERMNQRSLAAMPA